MEQESRGMLESPDKSVMLLNGSLSEQLVSSQPEAVPLLDGKTAYKNDGVVNSPIPVQDSHNDRQMSPSLSYQSSCLIKEVIKSEDGVNAEGNSKKQKTFVDASFKHVAAPDVFVTEMGTTVDGTNAQNVTPNASTKCPNSTISNSPDRLPLSRSFDLHREFPTCQPPGDFDENCGCTETSAKPEVEMEPVQLDNPQSAIDGEEVQQVHVVDDVVIPRVQRSSDETWTTLKQPESESQVECADEVPAMMEADKKLEEGSQRNCNVQSPSSSKNSPVGDAHHIRSDEASNSQVMPPGDPLNNYPSSPADISNLTTLTSNQKTSSKLRGNAMIFIPDLSEELLQGYRILTEIFGDKCKSFVWPFLDAVDTEELWDYETKIKHPMWLRKIESKFINKEYQSITEFAVDMRQMLENCYRYNGMKHQISKYAQTLECVFEQKLALLSRPLQEKTTLYVTSNGKYKDGCPDTIELSSGRLRRACTRLAARAMEQASAAPLAFHIRRELEQQEREEKRQKIVDRRDEIIKERQDLLEWDKQLIGEPNWTYMKSLWEIPAIGHFLCLCQSVLELEEISFFELERSFAIPMESMILRRIFTTLLSTPYQRTRLAKKPPMPYKVWEARLREWVRGWYIVLNKLCDRVKVYEKIGVPERFFEVLGPYFPLDRMQYHELTYYERVWVLKALCDQLFETQLVIRRCVLSQPVEEQRPIILGVDGDANSYIHFPQFCGADLRVYRQAKYPDLLKKAKKDKLKVKEAEDSSVKDDAPPPCKLKKTPKTRKSMTKPKPVTMETPRARPSRLRQKLTPTVHFGTYAESIVSSTESEDVTSELTEMEEESEESDSQAETSATSSKTGGEIETMEEEGEEKAQSAPGRISPQTKDKEEPDRGIVRENHSEEEKLQLTHDTGVISQEKSTKTQEQSTNNENLTAISRSDETEQLCNGDTSSHSSTTSEKTSFEMFSKSPTSLLESKREACENAKETHIPCSDSGTGSEIVGSSTSQDDPISSQCSSEEAQPKGTVVDGAQNTNNNSSQMVAGPCEVKPSILPDSQPSDATSNVEAAEAPPSSPPEPHEEVLPVLGEFELVCDGMDSLRELVEKFGPPENKPAPPTIGRKRKAASYVKQPVRKRCERDLHEKLTNLLLELTPWEAKLAKFAMRNRERFKKEYEVAKAAPETDQDIKDIWASEESSSESESCESESEDEEEVAEQEDDEEWDASSDGMRLRRRTVKKAPPTSSNQDQDDAGSVNDDNSSNSSKKPKKPKSNTKTQRSQESKKSPPHKNQLNTSLLDLIKKLSTDGLKDASRRLQTMIKRGEATRSHNRPESKIDSVSCVSGCGDGQAVTSLLNKTLWVAAKPPSVEGTITQSVEELIRTYPVFVQNLIFRNLKNSLTKMANAAKSANPDLTYTANRKSESDPKEGSAKQDEPLDETSQPGSTEFDSKTADTTPNKIETKFSLSNTRQQIVVKMGSKSKTREVMDDLVLEGLYVVLALTKGILRERLATGLSELLPDYTNLQESVVKPDSLELGDAPTASLDHPRNETNKELLLKMLPKPSQYLKSPQLTSEATAGLKFTSNISFASSSASTARTAKSIVVPVPTAKLPALHKSGPRYEPPKGTVSTTAPSRTNANPAATANNPQPAGNANSVPHGVYTIKVDANVWSQLQGKPELQQQFVLQQIKEMQRKETETSVSSTLMGDTANSPARAVTCIRNTPRAQLTTQQSTAPTATASVRLKNTCRVTQIQSTQNLSGVTSLQPIKLNKQSRPRSSSKPRSIGEPASNLSQKELIALLQQQQRQLELHRQQQQKLKKLEEEQQQAQAKQVQQAKQHFVLSASGALVSSAQPQQMQVTGAAPKPTGIPSVVHSAAAVVLTSLPSENPPNTSFQSTEAPCQSMQLTRLSTKTTVTASVKQPKMTVNQMDSHHGVAASTPAVIHASSLSKTVAQVKAPHYSTSVASSPRGQGTRLHLVQTDKGTQFILQTGSGQAPRLLNVPSSGNVGKSVNTLPLMVAGQTVQLVKQSTNQPAAVVVSSMHDATVRQQSSQTFQFVMQPNQVVSNDTVPNIPQHVLQLGQAGQGVQVQLAKGSGGQPSGQVFAPSNIAPNAKSSGLHVNQGTTRGVGTAATVHGVGAQAALGRQNPPDVSPSKVGQFPGQTGPAVIQKQQLAVLRGLGDSKVVIGNPTKVVRLVQPSHLSTATSFVPTPVQGQTGRLSGVAPQLLKVVSQGMQVINPVNQQVVRLPVAQGKITSVEAAQLATAGTGMPAVPSESSSNIQEQVQRVILQQLASGKMKLASQPASVTTVALQVSPQQAAAQQMNAGNFIKTLPVVLSQQATQLKVQQLAPPAVVTNPSNAVIGVQFTCQSQTNLPQSVQIVNQASSVQNPALRVTGNTSLGNVPSQTHISNQEPRSLQMVSPAGVGSTQTAVSASQVLKVQSLGNPAMDQTVAAQVIVPSVAVGSSNQQVPLTQDSTIQKAVKRSLVSHTDTVAKLPRFTGPDQVITTFATVISTPGSSQ